MTGTPGCLSSTGVGLSSLTVVFFKEKKRGGTWQTAAPREAGGRGRVPLPKERVAAVVGSVGCHCGISLLAQDLHAGPFITCLVVAETPVGAPGEATNGRCWSGLKSQERDNGLDLSQPHELVLPVRWFHLRFQFLAGRKTALEVRWCNAFEFDEFGLDLSFS